MKIEFDMGGRPIYLQIVEKIRRVIAKGEFAGGERILPVREMAIEVGVNPNTVARAYAELEREGILESRRGMGIFVTQDKEKVRKEREKLALQYAERFGKEIQELGIPVNYMIKLLEEKVVHK